MRYSRKKLLVAIALMATTLGVSFVITRRMKAQEPVTLRWEVAYSFEGQVEDGKTVAMTAIKKDGTRIALRQERKPTFTTSCPTRQRLSCWEDEAETLSMCVCASSATGGGGGLGAGAWWAIGGGIIAANH